MRVSLYASRSSAASMTWCSDENTRSGWLLASSAIRASFVELFPELSVSDIFPLPSSLCWTPLSSAGPREASSPLPRYYERLRLLITRSASLRFPSLRGTLCARFLRVPRRLLHARARLMQASDFLSSGSGSDAFTRGGEISQVPVVPLRTRHALRPRWSLRTHDRRVPRCSLHPHYGVGLHDNRSFGAQSHGPHARCLRFVAVVAHVDARLASGWWSALAERVRYCSARHPKRVSPILSATFSVLPLPASPGAQRGHDHGRDHVHG